MRNLYLERAHALVHHAERHLGGALSVVPPDAGMHTVAWLPPGSDDSAVSRQAAEAGVVAWALSSCYRDAAQAESRPGLIMGFASYPEEAIEGGMRALARGFRFPEGSP